MRRFTHTAVTALCWLHCSTSYAQQYIPDKDFGSCGTAQVFFDLNGRPELKLTRVTTQSTFLSGGNFFAANSDSLYFLLVQYRPDGRPDTAAFGTNGIVAGRFGLRSYLNSFVVQPDGKIMVAGYINQTNESRNNQPTLYRLTPAGQPDPSFNLSGMYSVFFDGLSAGRFQQVMVVGGNDIVAAGLSEKVAGEGVDGIGLVKTDSSGLPYGSFGNSSLLPGRTFVAMDSVSQVLLFQADQNFILPFLSRKNGADSISLLKVQANGQVDESFGTGGLLKTGLRSETLSGVRLKNGKLLLGGTLNESGQVKKMQLMRFTTNLMPDTVFGTNGVVVLPTIGTSTTDNVLHSLQEQADGKLLLLGHRTPKGINNPQPLLLRLLADGRPDSSFNGTGNMNVNTEFTSGWRQVDTTDSTDFIISRHPDFQLMKFVPDTTLFQNVPHADFRFVVEKQKVFFENRSTHSLSSFWDFGEGSTSLAVNPVHTFLPGSYPVTLESTAGCGFSTLTKTVGVRGLYKVTPSLAPDNGFTSFRLYGYGWDKNAKVLLKKGSESITADTVFFDAVSQSLQANFRFRQAPTGLYDVVVKHFTCPPGQEPCGDTLRLAVEIQPLVVGKPWVTINGPLSVRPDAEGRRAFFTLNYGFSGNAAHYLVPLALVIQGKGKSLNPRLETSLSNAALAAGLPDSLKPRPNGFYRFYDQLTRDSVWVVYLADVTVPPASTNTIHFTVAQNSADSLTVRAFIGQTLFDTKQKDSLYRFRTLNEGCNDCLKCLLGAAGYIPGVFGCAADILSLSCSVSEFEITPETTIGDVADLGLDFASTTVGCATLTGGAFKNLMETFGGKVLDFFLEQTGNVGTAKDCSSALSSLVTGGCDPTAGAEAGGRYGMRRSHDPNEKTGPRGGNAGRYIGKNETLLYTTHFENLPAATAPAYRVEITDTLDKSVMDLSTFRFLQVSIAGIDYPVFNQQDSFAMDVPFLAQNIVVRATGRLDTASGIVTWTFTSLDAATMGLVPDIDRGFLPPNTDGISGTGAVGFAVQQKSTNAHLTVISNRATIVFDTNEPILTPVWTNIVDTLRPESQVLGGSFRILSDSTFSVHWTGSDAHAGLRNYKVAVSINDSAYTVLGVFGNDSTVVNGRKGQVYKFISMARDSVGNLEDPPANPLTNPDAVFVFTSVLPVELLAFQATREAGKARLSWSTAQEANASHFTVEHSRDGTVFTELGKVAAAGYSNSRLPYSFSHLHPASGINHYRLQLVDRDGYVRYSPVRLLFFDAPAPMVMRPNPARNRVVIQVTEPGGTLRLVTGTGRLVRQQRMSDLEISIPLSGLPPGVYIVTYTTPTKQVVQQKLVVQR